MIQKIIGGVSLVSIYILYIMEPTFRDFNTTKTLLKYRNLDIYILKEKEYSKIIRRIGELSKYPKEAAPKVLSNVLIDLKNSPFYDKKCENSYKNLFRLHTIGLESINKTNLILSNNGPVCKDSKICTKEELLKDLYINLSL